jgi:hypothetical protein
MRWDQLHELASRIRKRRPADSSLVLTSELLQDALSDMADPFLNIREPYYDFVQSGKYEQHDFRMLSLWEVRGAIANEVKLQTIAAGGCTWYNSESAFSAVSDLGDKCRVVEPGIIQCDEPVPDAVAATTLVED